MCCSWLLKPAPLPLRRGKLHAWFPGVWRKPLIATITLDAPRYTDVLAQMQTDAALAVALAAAAAGSLAIAGRVLWQKLS